MDFGGLIRTVCEKQQQELAKVAVEEKKEFVRSDKFLGKHIIRGMLTSGTITVTDSLIQIKKEVGRKGTYSQLHTEIKEGHWSFAFYFSIDVYEFRWFPNLEESLKYHLVLKRKDWCGEKLLLFVDKEAVHYIEVETEEDTL